MTRARRPDLLRLRPGEAPAIVGQRCLACGEVRFPPDPFGCDACGAHGGDLEPRELEPCGALRAFAVVHRHHRPRPATPFTVGVIALDAGPVLKAVLTTGEGLRIGQRMRAELVVWEQADDGENVVDLQFGPDAEAPR
ncbi:MAG: Zn-ribbon domain-containing OB-fold protein [Acidimicrobiales bacterium]